jgi:regulator of sigma E protease
LIVFAGPGFNFLFAILAFFLAFTLWGIPYATTEIGGVKPDSPAARAGLQKGDRVLSISGQPVSRWVELSRKIRGTGERPLALELQRGGQTLKITVSPQRMEVEDIFGKKVSSVIIGIEPSDNLAEEPVGPGEALKEAAAFSVSIAWMTLEVIYKLLSREAPLKTIGGPIMIAQAAGKQAEQGASYLIRFMAILSVNLTILNILPIPVLDGGHLFFICWEAIRRKPIPMQHREIAQALGLMLVLTLMALVVYQDILRLFNPKY